MLPLPPFGSQEAVSQTFHDFTLSRCVGQQTARFEERVGGAAEPLLRRDDPALSGGDREDGAV